MTLPPPQALLQPYAPAQVHAAISTGALLDVVAMRPEQANDDAVFILCLYYWTCVLNYVDATNPDTDHSPGPVTLSFAMEPSPYPAGKGGSAGLTVTLTMTLTSTEPQP